MEGVPVRWLGKCAGRLSYKARIQRIVSAFNPSRQACRPFEVALGSSEIPAAQCAPCGGAVLFYCVLRVCIAMLKFVRLFCSILPLPIIQSLARDTIVCLVGFLTIAHLHVGIPLLLRLI
jgi:hypothetical protein